MEDDKFSVIQHWEGVLLEASYEVPMVAVEVEHKVFSIIICYIMVPMQLPTFCGVCPSNWRASEVSETPSIATYRKKCLGVSTSKPQCACSQFYVKRRSGRTCIYEKPACCS